MSTPTRGVPFPCPALRDGPRRRQRMKALEEAQAQGTVTPALTTALNDPVVLRLRWLELATVAVIVGLMVLGAVAYLLRQRFPSGGPVYIIGEDGLRAVLSQNGFTHAEESALAVIASMDRSITCQKLSRATLLIRAGVPFYATNSDRTYPTPAGLVPGAGALLAALEAASDVAPILGGKPSPAMMNLAMQLTGTTPQQTLAVGDRIETDIAGGQNAACRTALVLSGVSTALDLARTNYQPDLVAADLSALVGL